MPLFSENTAFYLQKLLSKNMFALMVFPRKEESIYQVKNTLFYIWDKSDLFHMSSKLNDKTTHKRRHYRQLSMVRVQVGWGAKTKKGKRIQPVSRKRETSQSFIDPHVLCTCTVKLEWPHRSRVSPPAREAAAYMHVCPNSFLYISPTKLRRGNWQPTNMTPQATDVSNVRAQKYNFVLYLTGEPTKNMQGHPQETRRISAGSHC